MTQPGGWLETYCLVVPVLQIVFFLDTLGMAASGHHAFYQIFIDAVTKTIDVATAFTQTMTTFVTKALKC